LELSNLGENCNNEVNIDYVVAPLDRERFYPKISGSNKFLSIEQGQPHEGGSSYAPPPHIALNTPIPNLYSNKKCALKIFKIDKK
jgi:hypothetical protein